MKFGQFMSHLNRKNFIQKLNKNSNPKIKHNLYWKIKFLKQATYSRYVFAKLSKFWNFFIKTFLW